MQHGSSCTHYRVILPFSHSILLWSVRNNQLPLYPLLLTILIKCTRSVLTSIVWLKCLDLLSCLVLHKSFELLEHKSKWINSNTPSDLLSLLEKAILVYFPKAHPLHTPLCFVLKSGKPVFMSLSILKAEWWRWAILLCHNSHNSLPLRVCDSAWCGWKRSLYSFSHLTPIAYEADGPYALRKM